MSELNTELLTADGNGTGVTRERPGTDVLTPCPTPHPGNGECLAEQPRPSRSVPLMAGDSPSEIIATMKPVIVSAGETVATAVRRSAELVRQSAPAVRGVWDSIKARLLSILEVFAAIFQWIVVQWRVVLFNLAVLPVFGLIYFHVNAAGARMTFPPLALKLWKAGLPVLRRYHFWRDVDLAHVAALGLALMVWIAVVLMIHIYLYGGFRFQSINNEFATKFVMVAGSILLVADMALFFHGVGETGGILGGEFSLMQVILTIAWTTALCFLGFLHCLLEAR